MNTMNILGFLCEPTVDARASDFSPLFCRWKRLFFAGLFSSVYLILTHCCCFPSLEFLFMTNRPVYHWQVSNSTGKRPLGPSHTFYFMHFQKKIRTHQSFVCRYIRRREKSTKNPPACHGYKRHHCNIRWAAKHNGGTHNNALLRGPISKCPTTPSHRRASIAHSHYRCAYIAHGQLPTIAGRHGTACPNGEESKGVETLPLRFRN